ncbi:MAG TPA: hypothetical protein VFV30_07195 [Novosphingobium sp.]|nr:hypothetical protein [Novosphingobium sp.]
MSDDIDERLAAWLDGALSTEEAAAFERELESNPELARRAADWQANDTFLKGALAPLAESPIDSDLLARMGLAEPSTMQLAANDNQPFWHRHALPLGGAVAASLAALLLLAVPQRGSEPDALSMALDTTPSLTATRLADGRTIQPTLTVRSADGRWCREFREDARTALACRGEKGWIIEGQAAASGPSATNEIGLAAGGDVAGLDAAYRRIGASDPVGQQEEMALIKQGWSRR